MSAVRITAFVFLSRIELWFGKFGAPRQNDPAGEQERRMIARTQKSRRRYSSAAARNSASVESLPGRCLNSARCFPAQSKYHRWPGCRGSCWAAPPRGRRAGKKGQRRGGSGRTFVSDGMMNITLLASRKVLAIAWILNAYPCPSQESLFHHPLLHLPPISSTCRNRSCVCVGRRKLSAENPA